MFIIFLIPSLEELTSEEHFSFQHQLIFKQKEKISRKGKLIKLSETQTVWRTDPKNERVSHWPIKIKRKVEDYQFKSNFWLPFNHSLRNIKIDE